MFENKMPRWIFVIRFSLKRGSNKEEENGITKELHNLYFE
jgi:hypothetical protein